MEKSVRQIVLVMLGRTSEEANWRDDSRSCRSPAKGSTKISSIDGATLPFDCWVYAHFHIHSSVKIPGRISQSVPKRKAKSKSILCFFPEPCLPPMVINLLVETTATILSSVDTQSYSNKAPQPSGSRLSVNRWLYSLGNSVVRTQFSTAN